MLNFDLMSAIVFYSALAILFIVFRKRLKIIQGIVIGFTTDKFNNFLKKLGSYRRLWRLVGNVAIIVSILGMAFISFVLIKAAYLNLSGTRIKSFGLVVPGVKIPGSPIYIPFWYGIISIFILIVVHEFSHAIMAYAERIKVNSVGFGLLLIFPVAFVQPDEKKFKRARGISRARVAAMGPFGNVVLSLFALGLIVLLMHLVYSSFFVVAYPINNSINMSNGTRIYSVNGVVVHTPKDVLMAIRNSSTVNLVTENGNYSYNITDKPKVMYKLDANNKILLITYNLLTWLMNLSFAIGLVNLLPIVMLDGGIMIDGLLDKFVKDGKKRAKILLGISTIFITLLIFDLVMSYI